MPQHIKRMLDKRFFVFDIVLNQVPRRGMQGIVDVVQNVFWVMIAQGCGNNLFENLMLEFFVYF